MEKDEIEINEQESCQAFTQLCDILINLNSSNKRHVIRGVCVALGIKVIQ